MSLESGSSSEKASCESEIQLLISRLDAEFTSEKVNEALNRIFKPTQEIANLPPASDVLIKHLELTEKKFGHEQVMDALSAAYEKRVSSYGSQ